MLPSRPVDPDAYFSNLCSWAFGRVLEASCRFFARFAPLAVRAENGGQQDRVSSITRSRRIVR